MRKVKNAYKILTRKSQGKRKFGKPRFRCEDNIKMDPKVMVSRNELGSFGSVGVGFIGRLL